MITDRFIKRGSILRNVLERYVVGKRRYQWFFYYLHLFAIAGLNYGQSSVFSSGEHFVMKWFRKRQWRDDAPVIFDVGSNIGLYSMAMLNCLDDKCKIYAFEPSPSTFGMFCKKVISPMVTAYNLGLSDHEGKMVLYSDQEGSGIASVYHRTTEALNLVHQSEISLTTVDKFCWQENIQHIDFMKLDVEGHELNVLLGAAEMLRKKAIDVIQFEFGGCNVDSRTYFHDFWELLHNDFEIYRVLQDGFQKIEKYSSLDEIFVTVNFVAVRKI